MSAPYITSRSTALDFSKCESATEVADAFQLAVNQLDEAAKVDNLRPVWGEAVVSDDIGASPIWHAGPWLIVKMIGER